MEKMCGCDGVEYRNGLAYKNAGTASGEAGWRAEGPEAPGDKRVGQVLVQGRRMSEALNLLDKAVDVLGDRLGPVLSEKRPSRKEDGGGEKIRDGAEAPLAADLAELCDRVCGAVDRLGWLVSRLEV